MHTPRKPAELRLVNGTDTIVIRPRQAGALDPIMCRAWDLGAPDMRYTTVPNPGADGVTVSDGFVGARTVTLDLAILGGRDPVTGTVHDAYWYATRLARMTHPAAAPVLQISRADELNAGRTWSMALRGSPFQLPFTARSGGLLEMQLVFTCPLGLIEGPLLSYSTRDSIDDASPTDWVFPATFPKTFGLTSYTYPLLTMLVDGDAPVTPTIYISGPVTDPDIRSGGDRFRFDGLKLVTGQTVQIDMTSGSIRLGDAVTGAVSDDMTAYNLVDWKVSSFWRWLPGVHTLRFHSKKGAVTVQFRERRLTI